MHSWSGLTLGRCPCLRLRWLDSRPCHQPDGLTRVQAMMLR